MSTANNQGISEEELRSFLEDIGVLQGSEASEKETSKVTRILEPIVLPPHSDNVAENKAIEYHPPKSSPSTFLLKVSSYLFILLIGLIGGWVWNPLKVSKLEENTQQLEQRFGTFDEKIKEMETSLRNFEKEVFKPPQEILEPSIPSSEIIVPLKEEIEFSIA